MQRKRFGSGKPGLRLYNRIHKWISRYYSKAGVCEHCHEAKKTQWSNVTGQYMRDRDDWQELCPKCHAFYDAAMRKKIKPTRIHIRKVVSKGKIKVTVYPPEMLHYAWFKF